MNKIYVWDNNPGEHDMHTGIAVAEDGKVLASHLSSSRNFVKYDMGVLYWYCNYCGHPKHDHGEDAGPHKFKPGAPDWSEKHPAYAAHYPDGYELIWVEEALKHKGLMAAMALNKQRVPCDTKECTCHG